MKGYDIGNNVTVIKMASLNITGNVIPLEWFKHLKLESGKPDNIAIMILSDIVYWYRPIEIRDEESGALVGYRKKFAADKLQRSYDGFADVYGYTKDQARDALKRLEETGLIDLDFRHPTIKGVKYGNLLYIGLNVENLSEISHPLSDLNPTGSGDVIQHPLVLESETNTEITTEITTEPIYTPDPVFVALENLTGGLNTNTTRFVDSWREKHTDEYILQAVNIAKAKGAGVAYCDTVLIGWEANGYPKTREQKVVERRNETKTPANSDDKSLLRKVAQNAFR